MRSRAEYLWTLAALLLILGGSVRVGGLFPPPGPILDPSTGIWGTPRSPGKGSETHPIDGLGAPTQIVIDRRGVPHIYASTDLDAWRALGWMHARDRLFQMELQGRATEGTLTEWVGPPALPLDREMRRLGLAHVADSLITTLDPRGTTATTIAAYAEGVGAEIRSLSAADLPFEYHLLGISPREWRPVHTLYLYGRMAYTLSWNETELDREWLAGRVGDRAAAALLPAISPLQEPVVPVGARVSRRPASVLPAPARARRPDPERRTASVARTEDLAAGSNNWVAAPSRTKDGAALLAGDPHLSLTLPSVWYEAELHSDQGLEIYGVTLPGAPAVFIGFTPGVAWSFTNSSGDFVDRYDEVVDDSAHPTKHLVDGVWCPVRSREERYRARRGTIIAVDTFYATERGPLVQSPIGWRSIRWTALEAHDPLAAYLRLQHARSVTDFIAAQALIEVPSQNGVAADTRGHIAEVTPGRYPRRPGNDGGRIFDGTKSAEDWQGDLPPLPATVDPSRGYLFSANQQIVDPGEDPAYRGSDWPAPWRAMRLAELLLRDSAVTPETFRRWQTDPISVRAEWWTGALDSAGAGDPALATPLALLAGWRDGYRPSSRAAPLFERAMEIAERLTWDEIDPSGHADGPLPSPTVLAALRDLPDDPWWDIRATPVREGRDDILRLALAAAWRELSAPDRLGPDTTSWRWDLIRKARIAHIARMPGLGASPLSVTGGNGTLSPLGSNTNHGPSWRMVVELTSRPRAWTTYPGGQSGDPSDPRYDDRIAEWQRGELEPAIVTRAPSEISEEDRAETILLVPGPNPKRLMLGAPLWWALIIGAGVAGIILRRRDRSPWWGALGGVLLWGAVLFAGWVPDRSWRLAARFGGVLGGLPAWATVAITLGWACVVGGVVARGTAALVPKERAAA